MNSKSITPNQIIGATIVIAFLAVLSLVFLPKMLGKVAYTQDHWNSIVERIENDELTKAGITVQNPIDGAQTIAVNLKDTLKKENYQKEVAAISTDGKSFIKMEFKDGEKVLLYHEKDITFFTLFEKKTYEITNEKLMELINLVGETR